jgi:hypothetical protein
MAHAVRHGQADAQNARLPVCAARFILRRVNRRQGFASAQRQGLTDVGRGEAARRALKQRDAEPGFHNSANSGLSRVNRSTRRSKSGSPT